MTRGCVTLAIEEVGQQTVALKVIRLTGESDLTLLRRFTHEYTVLSYLQDPHVARIFRHGFARDYAFVAMEYCQGGDLRDEIKRGIPMSAAVDYLAQIMRGLKAAHERGILHRDIKPSNLLLRDQGTLVLTDFGVERDLSENPRLTTTRSVVDDLGYVSPESIRHGTVDERSDLYSAGVVLYHLITGSVPFANTTVTAMLDAHLSAPIPRLPLGVAALQPLIDGLLAKDPNERFQSAADVLDAIEWLFPTPTLNRAGTGLSRSGNGDASVGSHAPVRSAGASYSQYRL
jgi:serine/threonine-protein kinase PpkA